MRKVVNRTIERDQVKWAVYTPRPSEFICMPNGSLYQGKASKEIDKLEFLKNFGRME